MLASEKQKFEIDAISIKIPEFIESTIAPKPRRNEVRWRPGQKASMAPPCSNLRFYGSKYTELKKVLVTLLRLFGAPTLIWCPGNCAFL